MFSDHTAPSCLWVLLNCRSWWTCTRNPTRSVTAHFPLWWGKKDPRDFHCLQVSFFLSTLYPPSSTSLNRAGCRIVVRAVGGHSRRVHPTEVIYILPLKMFKCIPPKDDPCQRLAAIGVKLACNIEDSDDNDELGDTKDRSADGNLKIGSADMALPLTRGIKTGRAGILWFPVPRPRALGLGHTIGRPRQTAADASQ